MTDKNETLHDWCIECGERIHTVGTFGSWWFHDQPTKQAHAADPGGAT